MRAAQTLRGYTGRVRGLRRLLVPVLEDALERSLSLAAGMDTRGYGRTSGATPRERRTTGGLMLLGLRALAVGVYGGLDQTTPGWLGRPMLLFGVVVAVVAVWARRPPGLVELATAQETAAALAGCRGDLGVPGRCWLVDLAPPAAIAYLFLGGAHAEPGRARHGDHLAVVGALWPLHPAMLPPQGCCYAVPGSLCYTLILPDADPSVEW